MGFLDALDRLRKEPPSARRRVLAFTVAAVMVVLIALWVQTIRYEFSFPEPNDAVAAPAPFADSLRLAVDGLKTSYEGVRNQIQEFRNLKNQ